jgi:hypothetical protein
MYLELSSCNSIHKCLILKAMANRDELDLRRRSNTAMGAARKGCPSSTHASCDFALHEHQLSNKLAWCTRERVEVVNDVEVGRACCKTVSKRSVSELCSCPTRQLRIIRVGASTSPHNAYLGTRLLEANEEVRAMSGAAPSASKTENAS